MKTSGYLFWIVFVLLFYWGFSSIFNRAEIVECREWAEQAEEFKDFYLLEWQKEQCDYHGIVIQTKIVKEHE